MKRILWLVLIVPSLLLGCGENANQTPTQGQAATSYGPFVATYDHDGHKFVVFYKAAAGTSNGGCAALHHPSCPCLKSESK